MFLLQSLVGAWIVLFFVFVIWTMTRCWQTRHVFVKQTLVEVCIGFLKCYQNTSFCQKIGMCVNTSVFLFKIMYLCQKRHILVTIIIEWDCTLFDAHWSIFIVHTLNPLLELLQQKHTHIYTYIYMYIYIYIYGVGTLTECSFAFQ